MRVIFECMIKLNSQNIVYNSRFFFRIDKSQSGILCCAPDYSHRLAPEVLNPACEPIDIPTTDPFFGPRSMKCQNFVRIETTVPLNCEIGPVHKVFININIILILEILWTNYKNYFFS